MPGKSNHRQVGGSAKGHIRKIITLIVLVTLGSLPAADRHEQRLPNKAAIQAAIEAFRAAGMLQNMEDQEAD